MNRRFSLEKQPSEKLTIGIDYANDLATGETIASAIISAINLEDDSDVSATILDGAVSISGSIVSQKIKAGTDAIRYKITYKATTSSPHIFEADVIMTVVEL